MSEAQPNSFLALTPTQIDVLDDMMSEWRDKDRHGELESEHRYRAKKLDAFYTLSAMITEAWKVRVNYADVEESEA